MKIGKFFLRLIVLLVVSPVLYILVVLGARLLPQPAEELAAIKQMEVPTPPLVGRDASDMIWLWRYQVPRGDEHRVALALRDFYDHAEPSVYPEGTPGSPLLAYARYPDTPKTGEGVCDLMATNVCLDYVRAHADEVAHTLETHRDSVTAGLRIAQYDGMRYGLLPKIGSPVPQLDPHRRLVPTYFAQRFAKGEQAAALDGLCQDMAGWRRVSGNSDHLIVDMVGAAFARQDLILLAAMLAELPADVPLSASCQAALSAPTDAELDICPDLHTDFPLLASSANNAGIQNDGWLDDLWGASVDKPRLIGRAARQWAVFCGPQAVSTVRQDQSAQRLITSDLAACTAFERAVDPRGCQLAGEFSASSMVDYADRPADLAASIGLMRTVLWLRQQPGGAEAWPRLLDARPDSLGLKRTATIAADGRSLSIPLLHKWMDTDRQSLAIGPAP